MLMRTHAQLLKPGCFGVDLCFSFLLPITSHPQNRTQAYTTALKKREKWIYVSGPLVNVLPFVSFIRDFCMSGMESSLNETTPVEFVLHSLRTFFKCRLFPALEIYFFCFLFYSTMNEFVR